MALIRPAQSISTLIQTLSLGGRRFDRREEAGGTFPELGWHPACSDCAVLSTPPLPIAIVMGSLDPGGTEGQMIELVRRLDPSRWTVHLVCFARRGGWWHRAAGSARSVVDFPVTSFKSPSTAKHLWAFAKWCRGNQIAIAHTTELYSNIFGLPGAALGGVPVRIGSRRGLNSERSCAHITMQRAAYECAHTIVANSQAAADRLRTEHVPVKKIAIVPNGVDFDRLLPRVVRGRLRKVVVVANLRHEKGHDVLIDAAARVLRRFPDASFNLVGSGPEYERLRALAQTRGVSHAVTFLGHREDVPAHLADADIFVLPSRTEAFPNAVLEAMATGLPVVASAVGGLLELVEDGRNGLLVRSGDPVALADGLCRLMADSALAAHLGDAARDAVRARYSFTRMVNGFEQIYLTELAQRGSLQAEPPRQVA
jgi:L-malate glycosyltransferase